MAVGHSRGGGRGQHQVIELNCKRIEIKRHLLLVHTYTEQIV